MVNVQMDVKGKKLHITVDLSEEHGRRNPGRRSRSPAPKAIKKLTVRTATCG